METNDLLYMIFERLLFQQSNENPSHEEFAVSVAEEYLLTLARQGVLVPLKLLPVIEVDLLEDITDMLRKKTYGSLSILEFRLNNATVIESYLSKKTA